MENFKKSNLIINNNKFIGGFTSLSEEQIGKIKGGKKDMDNNEGTCTNGICSGNNADCVNTISCS